MDKYIVDTSVAVKLFLDETGREQALNVFRLANRNQIRLLAPSLILYELNNALICQGFSQDEVHECLIAFDQQIEDKVIEIIPPTLQLLNKTIEIALLDTQNQGYISSYDATFHALALLRNAVFLTADKKHYQKTVNRIGAVMLLENGLYEWM
jgi:predicted nucleic acid-binding protein